MTTDPGPTVWTLAIDTASIVTAALARDGELVAERSLADTRAHTEALMPMVQDLCAEAGTTVRALNRFVVGVGPGPFTGLRVGIVTACTLAALASTTARGVCTLDVLALQAAAEGLDGEFLTCLDARRKEVYWARYDASGRRLEGPQVSAPADLPALPAAGPGARLHGLVAFGPEQVSAAALAVHADRLPDAGLQPLYLRKPDATVPTARKSTLLPAQRLRPRRERRPRPEPSAGGRQ